MNVRLTPDQKVFVRRAIESGRLRSEEDAVDEALALWEERERQRAEFLLTLEEARPRWRAG
jgi:Arc/MetJ-type ribon-helix-helix transcriptional regulator